MQEIEKWIRLSLFAFCEKRKKKSDWTCINSLYTLESCRFFMKMITIFFENVLVNAWCLKGFKLSLAFLEDANRSTGICTLHNLYISMNFKNHGVICESVLYSSTNYYSCIIMPHVWTLIPLDAENAKTQFYTGFKDRCTNVKF